MALRNTDEDETMPMYTPKLRELAPEPVEHSHPLPELDPRAIAPDGVADSRTKTQPLPLSWLKALVGLTVLLAVGCGPSTDLPVFDATPWAQLESCYLFCDEVQVQCGARNTCYDDCSGGVERVTDACRPLAIAWFDCMAEDEPAMNCSASTPLGKSCEDVIRDYHDCMFGGG